MFDMFDRQYIGLVTLDIDAPAPGGNFLWQSPLTTRIMVHSIFLTLTTDANVANRRVLIQGYTGSSPFVQSPAPGHQTASEAIDYRFAPCVLGIDESADLTTMWAPISEHLFLDSGDALASNVLNIQATDQLSDIRIRYYQRLPR